ncbi:hypothetical protein ACHAXT_007915 [Thalassiosira profunda]
MLKGTPGKRRKAPLEGNGASTSPDTSPGGKGTNGTSSSSGGGIDAFLHRLDTDADLNRMKKDSRKSSSDLDALQSAGGSASNKKPKKAGLLKHTIKAALCLLVLGLIYDTAAAPPEKRLLGGNRIHDFLLWVKEHPGTGAAAFIFVYGLCVVLLLPGTPLTLGGGYVYKVAYGWVGGVAMATFTSMAGSLFGSCSCFVLGRYIMRERVRKWGRKYPLFDAIDIAVSDNGFKIMCLLYLTPILPLGPVSYLIGTTSMPLLAFASAKIGALPLMMLYVFIGASTDTFFGAGTDPAGEAAGGDASKPAKKIHGVDEATHRKMVLFGLGLSIVSMSLVSHFVKKELYKIFDKQKKEKGKREGPDSANHLDDEHMELVGRTDNLMRRHTAERTENGMLLKDEEKG